MRVKRQNLLISLGIMFFVIGGIIVYIFTGGTIEDVRETRQYGDMTCVYNKTLDKIEACSNGSLPTGNG